MFNEFIYQIMDCHMENESCTGIDLIFISIGEKAIHMELLTVLDVAVISIAAWNYNQRLVIIKRITKILALLCESKQNLIGNIIKRITKILALLGESKKNLIGNMLLIII